MATSPAKSGLSDSIEATIDIIQKSLSSKPQVCVHTCRVYELCWCATVFLPFQSSHRGDLEQRVTCLERENAKLKKGL